MKAGKIIFVYNADSGFVNAMIDLARKAARKYDCILCAITYQGVRMERRWKEFVDSLGVPSQFLHRDEFRKKYPKMHIEFPAILLQKNGKYAVLVSSQEFDKLTDLDDLITLMKKKLGRYK